MKKIKFNLVINKYIIFQQALKYQKKAYDIIMLRSCQSLVDLVKNNDMPISKKTATIDNSMKLLGELKIFLSLESKIKNIEEFTLEDDEFNLLRRILNNHKRYLKEKLKNLEDTHQPSKLIEKEKTNILVIEQIMSQYNIQ